MFYQKGENIFLRYFHLFVYSFWDLRRWGNYVTTTNGLIEADVFGVARGANPRSIAQSNGGYWPIHTDELGANPNLVQTPGW